MKLEPESIESSPQGTATVQNKPNGAVETRENSADAENSATKAPQRVRVGCSVCKKELRAVVRGDRKRFWAPRRHGGRQECPGTWLPASIVNGPEIPADPEREQWAAQIAAEPDPIEREFQQRIFSAKYESADHHEELRLAMDAIIRRYFQQVHPTEPGNGEACGMTLPYGALPYGGQV